MPPSRAEAGGRRVVPAAVRRVATTTAIGRSNLAARATSATGRLAARATSETVARVIPEVAGQVISETVGRVISEIAARASSKIAVLATIRTVASHRVEGFRTARHDPAAAASARAARREAANLRQHWVACR